MQNPAVEATANHWSIPLHSFLPHIVRIDKTNKEITSLFRPELSAVVTTDFYMAFD